MSDLKLVPLSESTPEPAPAAPVITQEEMTEWFNATVQLAKVKAREMELRKKIFGAYFPLPREGVNDYPMDGGFVLKGTHKITRDVDEAMLAAKQNELIEKKIPVASLIRWKPELVTKEYRKLTDDDRKIFEQILDIKVGSPSMEIVKPKR